MLIGPFAYLKVFVPVFVNFSFISRKKNLGKTH